MTAARANPLTSTAGHPCGNQPEDDPEDATSAACPRAVATMSSSRANAAANASATARLGAPPEPTLAVDGAASPASRYPEMGGTEAHRTSGSSAARICWKLSA